MNNQRTKLTFSLSETLADRLHIYAVSNNLSQPEVMRRALDYYLCCMDDRKRRKSILTNQDN